MKKLTKILFFAWMIGGVLFGTIAFLIVGFADGFTVANALICAIGGLAWGLSCFLITLLISLFMSDLFSSAKMVARLEKEEQKKRFSFEKRFCGAIYWEIGKKRERFATCMAMLWFGEDRLWFGFAPNRVQIRVREYPYDELKFTTYALNPNFIRIEVKDGSFTPLFSPRGEDSGIMDELIAFLAEKRLYREKSRIVTEKLFLTLPEADPENSVRLYFARYGTENDPFENREDDLYIHFADIFLLMEEYAESLAAMGEVERDIPGFTVYYNWEETRKMIDGIREQKPVDWELLLPWLEQALKWNGFYFNRFSPAYYRAAIGKEKNT